MTNEEKQELLDAIRAESQSVDELEVVVTLDGVNSLPALKGTQLVSAPVSLLRKPAEDAARTANAAAASAAASASAADAAAGTADNAAVYASEQAGLAAGAAAAATEAAGLVESAVSRAGRHPVVLVNDLLGDPGRTFAGWTEARDAVAGNVSTGGAGVFSTGCVMLFRGAKGWESWQFTGDPSTGLFDAGLWQEYASGGGSGSGFYNVTREQPLADGYYTLATAVAALADAGIDDGEKPGMIITFETGAGRWSDYRFTASSVDSFLSVAAWEEYGSGKIRQVSLNGQPVSPDADGGVNLVVSETEVDETLDINSTNPVQNSAVTGKLNEVEASTVFGMNAELSDDETSVRLALTNKSGVEIAAVDLPAGGGGGGGDASTTKVVLDAKVDHPVIKEGGNATLTYTYDHQYSSGDAAGTSTGQKAMVEITMRRGSTTVYSDTLKEVGKGSYTLDISRYLLAGTTDIYVKATATDPGTGRVQTRQGYVGVKVVTLSLSSGYSLADSVRDGGYGSQDTAGIPYAVSGSGVKTVFLYVDGLQKETATVTRSGTTNGSFSLPMTGLSTGRHTVQLVAEMEAGADLTLRSESVYLDVFKRGGTAPLIGTMHTFPDGRIFTNTHLTPRVEVGQYEELRFDFAVYNPDTVPALMTILRNGSVSRTVSVGRGTQVYSNRFTDRGTNAVKFVCGPTEYPFTLDVTESGIDIGEASYGLKLKLDASGRSNGEENPGTWTDGEVETVFENVDWNTSGWSDGTLKLLNGAKATVGYMPFRSDVSATGATLEFEFRLSNVTDRESPVISCMDGNKGFRITAEEAAMYTGSTKEIPTEDGGTLTTPVGVSMKFAPDLWLKVAFTVGRRSDGRLMELYINGIRSKADLYGSGDYFSQDSPRPITVDSTRADVELRNLRVYERAVSDDEELSNYIVDRRTVEEMSALIGSNDVLDDDTGEVSVDKLISKGKGVIVFVRRNGLDEVNATNNKSQDFPCDRVIIYTPWGDVIEIRGNNIRIQGTSSTKYPRKNYRIYCAKGAAPEVWVNGVRQEGNKIPVMPGDIPVKVLCPKADYSDSSMTHNTGMARLYNDLMKELGLLTPPQAVNPDVRSSINGYPVDVFSAETVDGERTYYGQYNLNNDKSDWADVTGMNPVKGADGTVTEWPCPIALEFLNNSYALDKFQLQGATDAAVDAELDAGFDDALEFNYPKDVFWNAVKAAEEGVDAATPVQRAAVKRLLTWIRDCVPSGADRSCRDLSTWKSEKFRTEIGQYFDTGHLLTYYLLTDYFAMVDQRAKNMILRTWDGLKWYITYYDGDTQLLLRNDCFLAYLYTLDRDTYDTEKGGYAFEGHDSWLWCLVLASLEPELKQRASALRQALTNSRALDVYNREQAANWCERIYNKSGKFKYIDPQVEGVNVNGSVVTYPYIYALQGSREAHRTHTVVNRFALLDARYETGNYTGDNIDLYMARTASDSPTVMTVVANEVYYFGYGTNNTPSVQPSQKAEAGGSVTLTFRDAFSLNDPMRIYGASRIRQLVTGSAGDELVGNINLNKCTALLTLDMGTTGTGGDFYMNLDNCRRLEEVILDGQSKVRTGSQASTELDLGGQTRLRRLSARGTTVRSVLLAKGAPLESAVLPATLTTLRLEYLPKLTMSGLSLAGYGNVETLVFAACPGLDWQTLAGRCSNLSRLRVEGVALEGDGTLLDTCLAMKGVDAEGNATDTCALAGSYRLTRYPDDDELAAWKSHYPELNILLPDYTLLEFDDEVADDANMSNLDNGTGYRFGTAYVPSGHVNAILKQRHRVLAKVTKKPTTRNVNMANVDTVVNNLDGEMTYCPLDDADSNKYADGSPAKLDGTEGDWMMYEPFFWSKGVNDYLGGKHYSCYSANRPDNRPATPEATVLTLDDLKISADGYLAGRKIMSGRETLAASYSTDSTYSVCKVDVSGYRRVRFPSVPGTNLVGSVFTDDAGTVVGSIVVPTLNGRFEAGMYLIADVPAGATALHFSVLNTAEFDKVVLSNSGKIEDMEPEWVANDEHLCAVAGSSVVGSKLRSCITGGSTAASMTWTDFHYYSVQRGMQQIDALMHSRIANLFYAKYGRRDSQEQCGAGQHSSGRITGGTAGHGMTDTVGYEEAHAVDDKVTDNLVDGLVHQYAWYHDRDEYGRATVTQVNNTCCLGYEDIYGNKYDMMDGVDLPNDSGNSGKWRIFMPDGGTRWVKGHTRSGTYTTAVYHGLYMDVVPVGNQSGSSSTYYCDRYDVSTAAGRAVYRGYSYANADGGVSNANAYYDAANAGTSVGSRLAFRGKLVRAQSVAAYKAKVEVA